MPSDAPVIVSTGGWYALAAIFEDRQIEFETWQQIVASEGGVACPVCGEPLATAGSGPSNVTASADYYCRFAGDHKFRVPGDVVTPVPGARMGRYG